jgi:lysophospholipase L1-like esterase
MRFICSVFLIFFSFTAIAQVPFADEIAAFKKQDSLSFPGTNKILFVGSSSFRLWRDMQSDFPNHTIINRGFGGATIADVLFHKDHVITPYAPKKVVIYCGENDLAKGTPPDTVVSHFRKLFGHIRQVSPEAPVLFVSIKPSPSRVHLFNEMKKTNEMIQTFLSTQKDAVFIDVFKLMLNKKGQPREELFVNDRLHMNRKGYDIWKKELTPILDK